MLSAWAPGWVDAAEETHSCAAIFDDARRLACYDKAFGAPEAPANSAARDKGEASFSFSAVVTAVEIRRDRFVASLDNGQVWAQAETNTRIAIRVGDTVTVRRGALGSYLLSNGQGLSTRIKRQR